jgi:hypothetical protein
MASTVYLMEATGRNPAEDPTSFFLSSLVRMLLDGLAFKKSHSNSFMTRQKRFQRTKQLRDDMAYR